MCTVVNLYKEKYDIYIGRARSGEKPNKWCNPFKLNNSKDDNERSEVLEKYRKHLWDQIKKGFITKEELLTLEGKRLGCFCKPKACHGDIIVKAVKWAKGDSL